MLYFQSYPDQAMKRNVNKAANEFEKLLNEEFHHKSECKGKPQNTSESHEKKEGKDDAKGADSKNDETKKDQL